MRKISLFFVFCSFLIMMAFFVGCIDSTLKKDNQLFGSLEGAVYVPVGAGEKALDDPEIPQGYKPLNGALIEVVGVRTYTDEKGIYRFSSLPVGNHTAIIQKGELKLETTVIVQQD